MTTETEEAAVTTGENEAAGPVGPSAGPSGQRGEDPEAPPAPEMPPASEAPPVHQGREESPEGGGEAVLAPPDPRRRSRPRRVLAVAVPVVLVLGALGVGGAYAGSAARGADTTAPTRNWGRPHPAGKDPASGYGKGRTDSALSRQLLPVPDGYRLGPDLDEYGNDSMLDGRRMTALLKGTGKALHGGRSDTSWEEAVGRYAPRGLAQRTYATTDGRTLLLSTQVMRARSAAGATGWYSLKEAALKKYGKAGPVIAGHRADTRCATLSTSQDGGENAGENEGDTPAGAGITLMQCIARHGDLTLAFTATDGEPEKLDTHEAAAFFSRQVERLKSTGAVA
ncbi:hypothetical protein AB0J21_03630 [Streptomyces sp. NPDC049954]|uniref:hypothetical protein n=1 Tax=Streptomyces sp. NPDC049954 TaxID=3155779 RepID=UPI00341D0195